MQRVALLKLWVVEDYSDLGTLWRAQQEVPTPTDPMGILKSTREFKAAGAGKGHTSAVRGGGRDPGVRRPGSGLGQPTARSGAM